MIETSSPSGGDDAPILKHVREALGVFVCATASDRQQQQQRQGGRSRSPSGALLAKGRLTLDTSETTGRGADAFTDVQVSRHFVSSLWDALERRILGRVSWLLRTRKSHPPAVSTSEVTVSLPGPLHFLFPCFRFPSTWFRICDGDFPLSLSCSQGSAFKRWEAESLSGWWQSTGEAGGSLLG